MPESIVLAAFVAAVLVMQAPPGPNNMLIVARAIGEGRSVALFTVLGMTLGAGIIQVPLLALGVAALAQQIPTAFDLLRLAGAGYLLWLGMRLLTSPAAATTELPAASCTRMKAFLEGMSCALIEPTSTGFMLAFLPQFVDPAAGPVALQLVILGVIQKTCGAFTLGAYGLAAGAAGSWMRRNPRAVRWQERIAGSVMIALGLRMALSGGAPR